MTLRRPVVERIAAATLRDGGVTADLRTGALLPPVDAWYLPRRPDRTRIVPGDDFLAGAVADFLAAEAPLLGEEAAACGEEPAAFGEEPGACGGEPAPHGGARLWLGTWLNPATGRCYLDIVTRAATAAEAVALARRYGAVHGRPIVAVCNPARGLTVAVADGAPIGVSGPRRPPSPGR
ncbi:hypothetical protein BIV57_15415 [Mangrovactinospora gilvigrisea]|uniref:Uncharacterized protein n=1 Tax=Mangrovactinospora gilvigrisea TaxID=1428644 RepID=A0A1J7CA73_9ACTN|nr:hypothetical protein [Mangrovactinospora gilvigrisea]OIV36546.1 hypothetical protein BIV57_15415 [Mangrovactinospora gilvigrisea]